MKRLTPVLLLVAACGSDSDPCADVTGTCVAIGEGAGRAEIQEAMINVASNSTIAFGPGTWHVDGELDLDVAGVTIKGAGMNETIISFADQPTGAQGILVTADDFTIEDIGLEDSPGDLLKIEGANGVTIRRVRAEWTAGGSSANGDYGLYPVQCQNVLIEESQAIGAADAGIYVGQSDNIIVRNSLARENVAGIEIENSTRAVVVDNEATGNTGGILVFNLPGLEVANGAGCSVHGNNIHDNNHSNFGANTVGLVPAGTGIALLAAHEVEIFDNTIANQKAINLGIISYDVIGDPADADYDPNPDTIYIHDNTFVGQSDDPNGPLGLLVISALDQVQEGTNVPDIAWDGIVPPEKADAQDPLRLQAALNICIRNNGDADFVNLRWPTTSEPVASFELSEHDCAHDPLPEVVLE